MPKLTATQFADLPDELQQEILKSVPVEHLKDIRIIQPGDVDLADMTERLHDLLMNMTRKECITVIIELIKILQQTRLPEDMPPELKMAADLELLEAVVDAARELIRQAENYEGDEDDGS